MSAFKTNPEDLKDLLQQCHNGKLQLPDFQRSWVWDEDRIRSLLASISQSFPVGAIMTLQAGAEHQFHARPVEGAQIAIEIRPEALLLDGQQRLTSLYQTTMRNEVVETVTARQKRTRVWFYIDMKVAMDPSADRVDAIITVPADRKVKSDFGKKINLDLSTTELEYASDHFPMANVFDFDDWRDGYIDHWKKSDLGLEKNDFFKLFRKSLLSTFDDYKIPVISLDKETSKEAVCLVFEKVNTGGKPLDAFELVTAMYAADGFTLRDDWNTRKTLLHKHKALQGVASTDLLQAVSLLHSRDLHLNPPVDWDKTDPPPISATRQALLRVPLPGYKKWADAATEGFQIANKLLHGWNIYSNKDLPYQSQLVPLAAILAVLGTQWEHTQVRERLALWYWCGVFGEQYSSAIEGRFAKDIAQVPAWALGGDKEPDTVTNANFQSSRLLTMRTRLSAAYKGVNALLMGQGTKDFRTGQPFTQTVFFEEYIDIHHIFPRDWCEKQGIKPEVYDSIINKTPLGYRTNRILGGVAPSVYVGRLINGDKDTPPINPGSLDGFIASHLIDPSLLKADDFQGAFDARRTALLNLIEAAMGKSSGKDESDEQALSEADDVLADTGFDQ